MKLVYGVRAPSRFAQAVNPGERPGGPPQYQPRTLTARWRFPFLWWARAWDWMWHRKARRMQRALVESLAANIAIDIDDRVAKEEGVMRRDQIGRNIMRMLSEAGSSAVVSRILKMRHEKPCDGREVRLSLELAVEIDLSNDECVLLVEQLRDLMLEANK